MDRLIVREADYYLLLTLFYQTARFIYHFCAIIPIEPTPSCMVCVLRLLTTDYYVVDCVNKAFMVECWKQCCFDSHVGAGATF